MKLQETWKAYGCEPDLNLSVLPEEIRRKGTVMEFVPKSVVVLRGEFPDYIYFIQSGTVIGTRDYTNGNEYNYFQLDETNGCIGLLEIMARKEQYVATIITMTEVTAVRIEAAVIYDLIMSDMGLMRRCITLLAEDLYMRSGNDGILFYLEGVDKVRFYLVHYYNTHKTEDGAVRVDREYQEIASQIGVSIRTVGRSLKKLKDAGEIRSVNKKVVLTEEMYHKLLKNICT